ncbi:hypothetical protein FWF93_02850 [Candidatus Saccharibacteria bacterium]|jgi:hypothetical protein|nr:hypothetical protein [Candidatus Saccharibacteria bacterium]
MFLAVSSSYYGGYSGLSSSASTGQLSVGMGTGALIWTIISIILAIIGGILVYALFLNKKNEGKFKGFLGWLYNFLKFKTMSIEIILKVCYLMTAIFFTLWSFTWFGTGSTWWMFFVFIIGGNLATRLVYELSLIMVMIWRNTEEIRKHSKK